MVLEMLKEEKAVNELAKEHGVHPAQLHQWRRSFLGNAQTVFAKEKGGLEEKKTHEKEVTKLYEEIGRLTTQLSWLKKI